MAANGKGNKGESGAGRGLTKGGLLVLAAILLAAVYFHHRYQQQQDIFINNYYFRTLQEVAGQFSARLEQLISVHKYGESEAAKRAIFPNYSNLKPKTCELLTAEASRDEVPSDSKNQEGAGPIVGAGLPSESNVRLFLVGGHIRICVLSDTGQKDAGWQAFQVAFGDLLPAPSGDFVLYLIAGSESEILGRAGGASGLSMVDTKAISRQVQESLGRSWANLIPGQDPVKVSDEKPLPGYSYHVDMALSSGSSRLFIQPFRLADVNVGNLSQRLFLIGVVPDKLLDLKENKRWNLSLLLLALLLLVFCWTFARLVMLSASEPLGGMFYCCALACTYLLFIMFVALWLSYGEWRAEIQRKHGNAALLMQDIQRSLATELYWLFRDLASFHRNYSQLTPALAEQEVESREEKLNTQPLYSLPIVCRDCPSNHPRRVDAVLMRHASSEGEDNFLALHRKRKDTGTGALRFFGFKEPYQFAPVDRPDRGPLTEWSNDWTNIFGRGANFLDADKPGEWFDAAEISKITGGPRLLNVFLMDRNGQQVLPKYFFVENNKAPYSHSLAHRDYFRKVRDQQGWSGTFFRDGSLPTTGGAVICGPENESGAECVEVENFYIQRLHNINTGTRGSTLAMPLQAPAWNGDATGDSPESGGDYILGADILFPSLSLTEWSNPEQLQDMVVMVVDRLSGAVLFHMDHERAMVENLFQSGQGTAAISHALRSGNFARKAIGGYYHGRSGDFMAGILPISQWALVVFIPDDDTDSLMTNFFLSTIVMMGLVLLVAAALIYTLSLFMPSHVLKQRLGMPRAVNRHAIMRYTAILTATVFFGFRIGSALERDFQFGGASVWFPLLALLAVLGWGCRVYSALRDGEGSGGRESATPGRGTAVLLVLFLAGGLLLTAQLQKVGDMPLEAMRNYYRENVYPARLNRELQELQGIALTQYPNSIKRYRADPLALLPISEEWRRELDCIRTKSALTKRHLQPEDIGPFSRFTYATGVGAWIGRYLLGHSEKLPETENDSGALADKGCKKSNCCNQPVAEQKLQEKSGFGAGRIYRALLYTAVQVGVFVLICWLWLGFYRRVIVPRLLGAPAFIAHLECLAGSGGQEYDFIPDSRLRLDLRGNPPPGSCLDALLQQSAQTESDASEALSALIARCPVLRQVETLAAPFPGVRICLQRDGGGTWATLSQLDICLAQPEERARLLLLIRQIKAMVVAGELAGFRICLECHSYETLLLSAPTLASGRPPLSSVELAQWSEVLMDFHVELPPGLSGNLDPVFINGECQASHLLRFLARELTAEIAAGGDKRRRWKPYHPHNSGQEWASIHYILLRAGALFRYHWERCSSAEKLALYYLAKGKRVNPANTQLLEQLALQGLIRVERGRIRIINNSFAYFVRHAESPESLKQLLKSGREGSWATYRLPITLIILFLVGAIAVTSGSSLYLIAATLVGLLGAIGSLVSSARMIHENLK